MYLKYRCWFEMFEPKFFLLHWFVIYSLYQISRQQKITHTHTHTQTWRVQSLYKVLWNSCSECLHTHTSLVIKSNRMSLICFSSYVKRLYNIPKQKHNLIVDYLVVFSSFVRYFRHLSHLFIIVGQIRLKHFHCDPRVQLDWFEYQITLLSTQLLFDSVQCWNWLNPWEK